MNSEQFTKYIIKDVLEYLNMYSDDAVTLLLGTFYQESDGGEYIHQIGGGPALGVFQIEPDTARDCYKNFLDYRPQLKEKVNHFYNSNLSLEENLIGNLHFQVALARIIYYRDSKPIPGTLEGVAEYWKRVYNTVKGAGTVKKFLASFKKHNKEN